MTTVGSPEAWRPVVGHEGLYEVSDLGRVRSMARTVTVRGRNGATYSRPVRPRVLRPARCGRYLSVTLWKAHECRVERAQVLVLEAFVGPRPAGLYACHDDDIGTNNRLSNLYWGTPRENSQDKIARGRQPRGSSIPWAKLTEADVAAIRAMKGRAPQKAIGEMFGIGQGHVSRIHAGHQWRHVATDGQHLPGAQA